MEIAKWNNNRYEDIEKGLWWLVHYLNSHWPLLFNIERARKFPDAFQMPPVFLSKIKVTKNTKHDNKNSVISSTKVIHINSTSYLHRNMNTMREILRPKDLKGDIANMICGFAGVTHIRDFNCKAKCPAMISQWAINRNGNFYSNCPLLKDCASFASSMGGSGGA